MNLIKSFKSFFNGAESKSYAPLLNKEIATTRDGRDITRGYVMPDMQLPSGDDLLQQIGEEGYRLIKQDDQVITGIEQRIDAVTSCEWIVDAGGTRRDDKKAADLLREALTELGSTTDDKEFATLSGKTGFDGVTEKMWYGIYYGLAVSEVMLVRDGANIALDAVKVRDRQRFIFDGDMRLRLLTNTSGNGELLPSRKFWAFNSGADHDDDPYGLGLRRWLYWPVFFKKQYQKFGAIHLEKFASPTVAGQYPAELDLATSLEDVERANAIKASLMAAVKAVQLDSGIIYPEGMVVSMLEASRAGSADYLAHYLAMQDVIAKVILGQTASSQGTAGKLGNEELRGTILDRKVKRDADLICGSFNNSVARWLAEWNYPNAALPKVWRVTDSGENLNQRAERDAKIFVFSGLKPNSEYLTQVYGDEYALTDTAQAAEPPPNFSEQSEKTTQQAINKLIQKLGAETESQFIKSSVNPIKELLDKSASFEEFLKDLDGLFPGMNKDDRAATIRDALLVSKLTGMLAVIDGD